MIRICVLTATVQAHLLMLILIPLKDLSNSSKAVTWSRCCNWQTYYHLDSGRSFQKEDLCNRFHISPHHLRKRNICGKKDFVMILPKRSLGRSTSLTQSANCCKLISFVGRQPIWSRIQSSKIRLVVAYIGSMLKALIFLNLINPMKATLILIRDQVVFLCGNFLNNRLCCLNSHGLEGPHDEEDDAWFWVWPSICPTFSSVIEIVYVVGNIWK